MLAKGITARHVPVRVQVPGAEQLPAIMDRLEGWLLRSNARWVVVKFAPGLSSSVEAAPTLAVLLTPTVTV